LRGFHTNPGCDENTQWPDADALQLARLCNADAVQHWRLRNIHINPDSNQHAG
jgi:hypothetical protein